MSNESKSTQTKAGYLHTVRALAEKALRGGFPPDIYERGNPFHNFYGDGYADDFAFGKILASHQQVADHAVNHGRQVGQRR